jgi:flagellar motor switch protein FliN
MADHLQVVVERIVGHLADVLAMTSGQAIRALPAVGSSPVEWLVPLTLTGSDDASLMMGVSEVAARRITGIVLGGQGTPTDAEVADALAELVGQATAAHVNQESTGATIVVGRPVREATSPPNSAWQHDLVMDGDDPPRVAVWRVQEDGTVGADVTAPRGAAAPGAATSYPPAPVPGTHRNMDVVLDLELPITVRFGETRLTLDALARLGAGSLIDLERAPDDPVDLLVNGRLVARGEVVVVAGCYGVRIREVVSAADRLRSLEA